MSEPTSNLQNIFSNLGDTLRTNASEKIKHVKTLNKISLNFYENLRQVLSRDPKYIYKLKVKKSINIYKSNYVQKWKSRCTYDIHVHNTIVSEKYLSELAELIEKDIVSSFCLMLDLYGELITKSPKHYNIIKNDRIIEIAPQQFFQNIKVYEITNLVIQIKHLNGIIMFKINNIHI